jgi:formylglycine-generating enzyme required for sulfatase activity
LWEFAHLASGAIAKRGADGKLRPGDDFGIVLVLIPGGTFTMGSQSDDPKAPHYVDEKIEDEGPVHDVTLAPYFLSKYEMTEGQWLRFTNTNPSQYPPGEHLGGKACTLACPVELVTWDQCTENLRRLGLVLPTEAQWERGARAGTDTTWWTGDDLHSIEGAANVADQFLRENGGPTGFPFEDWLDDGWMFHAPVGTFRANGFGLHDVIGNVWEWVRDSYESYELPVSGPDAARQITDPHMRVCRGGGYILRAMDARSGIRFHNAHDFRSYDMGVRPARTLTQP